MGSVSLPNPVMTASGTAGHGAELGGFFDLGEIGAVVVKSLAPEPWPGNPPPRLVEAPGGMLNSVGLQGPGVEAWMESELPGLLAGGARVVASIWGNTVEAYAKAAAMLAGAPAGVVAVEVNVSCPNLEDRRRMFAHSASATAEVHAQERSGLDLSADKQYLVESRLIPLARRAGLAGIAELVLKMKAGAEALTLVNTVMGLALDTEARRPALGGGGGGVSGPAIRPVAVRAVYDCRAAFPDAAIVGVGGVTRGVDAVELMMAGANAVQVGTATFADPRAPARVLAELRAWCRGHGVQRIDELIGAAHG